MYNPRKFAFDAEAELKSEDAEKQKETEDRIIELFLSLPRDRQKAILSELWSEFKPEKPKGLRNFNNLPF